MGERLESGGLAKAMAAAVGLTYRVRIIRGPMRGLTGTIVGAGGGLCGVTVRLRLDGASAALFAVAPLDAVLIIEGDSR